MGFFKWFKKDKNNNENNLTDESLNNLDESLEEAENIQEESEIKENTESIRKEIKEENILNNIEENKIEEIPQNIEKISTSQKIDEENIEQAKEEIKEGEIIEKIEEDINSTIFSEEIEISEEQEVLQNYETVEKPKSGFFAKIKSGLEKTRNNILNNIEQVLKRFTKIDEELYEELEEALIMADIGVETSMGIIETVRQTVKKEKITEVEEIKKLIIKIITDMLTEGDEELKLNSPSVILVIGVNGVGKTTTIGKLTHNFIKENKKIILAAADTFRAAAIDQLEVWAKRNNTDIIKHQENSDPGAVVFDAVQAAKSRKADILICDTAGRLHNKKNLMEELKKIFRIIKKEYENAQIEVLLVLDATTGQNALQQAKLFKEATDITGIVLTKLDGTAKGGIIIAIKNELKIPVRFIGVGESIEDLRPFDAEEFAKALFDM